MQIHFLFIRRELHDLVVAAVGILCKHCPPHNYHNRHLFLFIRRELMILKADNMPPISLILTFNYHITSMCPRLAVPCILFPM
jgi:hypothetical protein